MDEWKNIDLTENVKIVTLSIMMQFFNSINLKCRIYEDIRRDVTLSSS